MANGNNWNPKTKMYEAIEDANKILLGLQADSTIVFAYIYDVDKNVFAIYERDPEIQTTAPEVEEGYQYKKSKSLVW